MRPLALLLLFLSACTIAEPPLEQGTSSSSSSSLSSLSSLSSSFPSPLTPASLQASLEDWVTFWRDFLPDFELGQMTKGKTSQISRDVSEPLALHEDILDRQEEFDFPILFPSPSGDRVIHVSPTGEEPDSLVALITPDENLYERLLFCGTPCGFDGAVWVNDEQFAVTGFTEYYPESEERCTEGTPCTVVPRLLLFDLSKDSVTEYIGPEVDAAVFFSPALVE